MWFDPGLGYVLPGEVMEFHRAGQVITVQAVIGGKVRFFIVLKHVDFNVKNNILFNKCYLNTLLHKYTLAMLNSSTDIC